MFCGDDGLAMDVPLRPLSSHPPLQTISTISQVLALCTLSTQVRPKSRLDSSPTAMQARRASPPDAASTSSSTLVSQPSYKSASSLGPYDEGYLATTARERSIPLPHAAAGSSSRRRRAACPPDHRCDEDGVGLGLCACAASDSPATPDSASDAEQSGVLTPRARDSPSRKRSLREANEGQAARGARARREAGRSGEGTASSYRGLTALEEVSRCASTTALDVETLMPCLSVSKRASIQPRLAAFLPTGARLDHAVPFRHPPRPTVLQLKVYPRCVTSPHRPSASRPRWPAPLAPPPLLHLGPLTRVRARQAAAAIRRQSAPGWPACMRASRLTMCAPR